MMSFCCSMCYSFSSGFKYTDFKGFDIDATCGALSETIIHECHPCRLYYKFDKNMMCVACGEYPIRWSTFSCDDCKFVLDTRCVVLPRKIEHWYDEHLLSLCIEENTSGECWCDICEKKIGDKLWYYACDNCCVTFHIKCVLGDFSLLKPGRIFTSGDWRYEVMQTNPGFLPRCYICRSRRATPFVQKVFYSKKYIFICSTHCLYISELFKDLYYSLCS